MRALIVGLAVLAAACSSPGSDAGNSQAVEAQEDGAPRLARTLGEAGVPRIEDIPRLSGPVFDAAAPAAPAEASSSGDDELELPAAEAAVDLLPGDDVEELTSSTTDVANDDATESSSTTAPEETDAATTEDPEAAPTTPAPTTAAPTTQAPATTAPPAPDLNDCEQFPENCVEPGQDFSSLDLNSSVFFESDLSGIDFSNSNLADADFSDSRAIATNFTGATMTDSVIVGADMTGADFTNANLTDAFIANSVFARATWSNTTCPDGTNSNDLGGSCESAFG